MHMPQTIIMKPMRVCMSMYMTMTVTITITIMRGTSATMIWIMITATKRMVITTIMKDTIITTIMKDMIISTIMKDMIITMIMREHHHDHEGHGQHHDHEGHDHHHHHGCRMAEIEKIVADLPVGEKVKEDIISVYRLIAEAESHVHGKTVEEIHFHEVGTMDAVADVTAVSPHLCMWEADRYGALTGSFRFPHRLRHIFSGMFPSTEERSTESSVLLREPRS